MSTTTPALGMACAWCLSSDWERGELAIMPAPYGRGAIFHDRAGLVPPSAGIFDPVIFDPDIFDTANQPGTRSGLIPGPCYAAAVQAQAV